MWQGAYARGMGKARKRPSLLLRAWATWQPPENNVDRPAGWQNITLLLYLLMSLPWAPLLYFPTYNCKSPQMLPGNNDHGSRNGKEGVYSWFQKYTREELARDLWKTRGGTGVDGDTMHLGSLGTVSFDSGVVVMSSLFSMLEHLQRSYQGRFFRKCGRKRKRGQNMWKKFHIVLESLSFVLEKMWKKESIWISRWRSSVS